MAKRTRSQIEESDGSTCQRERAKARERQRRRRAGLTEQQLQEKRARDRLYKQKSRARKFAQTEATIPSSSGPSHSRHRNSKMLHGEDDRFNEEPDYPRTVTDEWEDDGNEEATTPVSLHDDEQASDDASQEEDGSTLEISGDEGGRQGHQTDGPDDGDESVDERDVFGEWFDQANDDQPYGTPTLHLHDEPQRDEEGAQDAPAITLSCTLSRSNKQIPLISPSPVVSSLYKDLVSGVLGVQVGADAETVTWTSGQRTVLPYLGNASGSRTKNALQTDRDYVADLAQAPEAILSSDLVVFLSKDWPEDGVLQAAQDALSRNKTVVVRGYVDTKGFELTEEQLWKRYSIFADRPVEPQDMRQRVKSFSKPHVKTTLKDFLVNVNSPDVVQMLLDFSFPQLTIPPPFERLDDGMAIGWAQTQSAVNYESMQLPADLWSERTWGIAHHAGIVSYPHHDAEGAATYCIPMAGVKSWVVVTPIVTRDKMKGTLERIICSGAPLSTFANKAAFETIHLYPGDLLIMPPGQLHTVYTPISGMCRGGHFFNLDTMHLTELSRFIDATHGESFTNQAHKGTLETLCRLVLALAFINAPRKLYKNSLIALCGMVAYHETYTVQGQPDLTSHTLELAKAIAEKVLRNFGITGFMRYQAHLKTTGKSPYERGEEVTVFDLLESFRK